MSDYNKNECDACGGDHTTRQCPDRISESSALEDNVGRTPERLVEEVREELAKIDAEFQYRDGIEATIARQDAVLRLTLWAVGGLARMMSDAEKKAPNTKLSDAGPVGVRLD